ncbi:hypothetical protein KA005_83555, partial [bacterium]|nr:hypothetical protein [bacterium]
NHSTAVIITAGVTGNSLGVIRAFGRRGIPVMCLDSQQAYMSRYSRYINRHLKAQNLIESETEFVNVLLNFGQQIDSRMIIIPTGDIEVLALSKYIRELEQFYFLPVPNHHIVQKLVNKRSNYKLLTEMQIPHPKTYFPESIAELQLIGRETAYPYIIKPDYSSPFQKEFGRKCFVITSLRELNWAIDRLRGKNLEVMIQEIVPGKEIYEFYTYLNRKQEPLGICGWDKIRQYPPDFGTGSFCKSSWRSSAIEQGTWLLKAIGYYGFAAPELKKDPRDGEYKLIEINARTTLQNRLAAACGADIEYIAYLDLTGQTAKNSVFPHNNVLWVDDFTDALSCLIHLKRHDIGIIEIVKTLKARKVHSVMAWDDPIPLFARAINLSFHVLCLLFSNLISALRKLGG